MGPITIWVSPAGVRRIEFGPLPREDHTDPPEEWPELLRRIVTELTDYFHGRRRAFETPLDLDAATPFQKQVYALLREVGHGHVTTYGELAEDLGRPESARAVGQAVGANPVPIIIPCHRVVAAEHRLGGYSGGLKVKADLLRLENVDVEGETEASKIHPEVLRLDL